jgi:hypothetical protein
MCHSNFIGLSKKCDLPEPTSQLYIDMLEGLSLKRIANIATGDQISAQELLNEKTQLVFANIEASFSDLLFNQVVAHSIDSLIGPDFSNEFNDASSNVQGVRIKKRRGALTKIFIERLYVKSNSSHDDLEILIDDGQTETTYTIDVTGGVQSVIELDYSTTSNEVNITINNETFEPYKGGISPFHRFWDKTCNDCGCYGLQVSGIDGQSSVTEWRGIKVDCSVQCDKEKMLCLVANHQRLGILYLVGSELMKEHVSSDRVNYLVINGKEWAAAKAQEWEAKGNEIFASNAQGITRYLTSNQKDCFICNSTRYGYTLP